MKTLAVVLLVLWPVLPFLARGLASADRGMVRGLLSPSDELFAVSNYDPFSAAFVEAINHQHCKQNA